MCCCCSCFAGLLCCLTAAVWGGTDCGTLCSLGNMCAGGFGFPECEGTLVRVGCGFPAQYRLLASATAACTSSGDLRGFWLDPWDWGCRMDPRKSCMSSMIPSPTGTSVTQPNIFSHCPAQCLAIRAANKARCAHS